MEAKPPKDTDKYRWTMHVGRKMRFYGLSSSRVLRVVNAPQRMEEGVAVGTMAGMQTAGTKAKPWEIWVMWREEGKKAGKHESQIERKPEGPKAREQESELSGYKHSSFLTSRKVIITAWRYPGTSPVRSAVPIPAGVLEELEAEGEL